MSEPSRCRAAGITHGVRFKKGGGGGREREARLGPLSAVVHFSLFDIFFPSSLSSSANALRPGSPSSLLLLALTPELRAKSPQGARQPLLRRRTGTGVPIPLCPPQQSQALPVGLPLQPPLQVAHFHKFLAQLSRWPHVAPAHRGAARARAQTSANGGCSSKEAGGKQGERGEKKRSWHHFGVQQDSLCSAEGNIPVPTSAVPGHNPRISARAREGAAGKHWGRAPSLSPREPAADR